MGVTLAVPLVLIAVLLAVTIGGVRDLGTLRQVIAGPAIPDTATAPAAGRSGPPGSRLPPIPSGPPVVASTRAEAPDAGGRRPRTRRRLARRVPGAVRRRTPGAQPAPATGTTPPSDGSPPRERPLRPVRVLGERVRRIVEPLPPPVGPTASDAIETVLDIVDPPKKFGGAQNGGPRSSQPAGRTAPR